MVSEPMGRVTKSSKQRDQRLYNIALKLMGRVTSKYISGTSDPTKSLQGPVGRIIPKSKTEVPVAPQNKTQFTNVQEY